MDDSPVHRLAEAQHGLVAVEQLGELGLLGWQVGSLVRHRGWERVTPRVLRREGAPESPAQRVMAAVLHTGCGAVVSHESAAALWGHPGARLERPVHLATTTNSRRHRDPAAGPRRVHLVRALPTGWTTELDGIPVARPELVALQLFASMRYERAERMVERLWSDRLLSGASLRGLLREYGRMGRDGTLGLRRYCDERPGSYRPTDSGLETRALKVFAEAGIHLRRQVDVGGNDCWDGRVDFLHVFLPLVVEIQSGRHHRALVDTRADADRRKRLKSDGFVVVEVTDEQVWIDPGAAVAAVRAGMDLASARSRAS